MFTSHIINRTGVCRRCVLLEEIENVLTGNGDQLPTCPVCGLIVRERIILHLESSTVHTQYSALTRRAGYVLSRLLNVRDDVWTSLQYPLVVDSNACVKFEQMPQKERREYVNNMLKHFADRTAPVNDNIVEIESESGDDAS